MIRSIVLALAMGIAGPNGPHVAIPGLSNDTYLPAEWKSQKTPAESELVCANRSRRRWQLFLESNTLRVRDIDNRPVVDDLPFIINEDKRQTSRAANRRVISVSDGWVVGFDGGEFSKGLWWFSPDGRNQQHIADVNVRGIVRIGDRILALVGLAHGSKDSGDVVEISKFADTWRSRHLISLPGAPEAFAVENTQGLLVLTTQGLVRIVDRGVQQLTYNGYAPLFPSSIVKMPSGALYIGLRHFIVRLSPAEAGYAEDWFVPRNCLRFVATEADCVCDTSP
jgi:hypothetical protein